ncbi:hypothetical protein Leryth_014044 [Lithospermum erythrorhizon]|nr:hypothetical protein Leryth_014044 [Lithospermum erythrorhizon]
MSSIFLFFLADSAIIQILFFGVSIKINNHLQSPKEENPNLTSFIPFFLKMIDSNAPFQDLIIQGVRPASLVGSDSPEFVM